MFPQFRYQLTFLLLILYLVIKISCSHHDHWLGFTHVLDDVMPNSALKMVSKESKIACIFACKFESHCVAFGFHQHRKECHLYTRNVKELGSVSDPGMKVYLVITDGSNIATHKPASTSSIRYGQTTTSVLDDNQSTCFETGVNDYQPWFLVDLMDRFLIHIILVYNDAEYPERLHDVNYQVYDSDPTINNSTEANCCASVVDYNTGKNIIRCNDGVHGRFVKISIEKSNLLTLCEVEIYGTPINETSGTPNHRYECKKLPVGENIALRKPTKSSSNAHTVYSSDYAVDGYRNNYWYEMTCLFTSFDDQTPWWQVDLEWMYDITSVTISPYRMRTHCTDYLSDVSVMVYDSDPSIFNETSKLCIFIPGGFGCTVRTFECDQRIDGRFIRITKPTADLTICEVEVTGIKH